MAATGFRWALPSRLRASTKSEIFCSPTPAAFPAAQLLCGKAVGPLGKPSVAQHGHPTWAPLADTGQQAGAGVPGFHAAGVDRLIRVRPEP